MRKFVMEAGWVPKKLGIFTWLCYLCCTLPVTFKLIFIIYIVHPDVYIDVPDIIDISHMHSKGLQPGEELLPEAGM